MMSLLERVHRFIRRHNLAGPDTRVLVALSGGSDSVALTHILRDLQTARDLSVVGLAHFNHQLRAAADEDERFCAHLAESLGWPMCVEREDVAALAKREHLSIEVAARSARHAFLERARIHLKADVVAVAHTRDDQAETFLLRLVRGAGPRGLAAMHPRNGAVVRPLLCCRRRELRAYLAAEQVAYVEDESNMDVGIPRNRVRAELVPLLERRFNPQIVNVLADEADIARDTLQWIEAEADELLARSLKVASEPGPETSNLNPATSALSLETCELDIGVLTAAPLALRRFAVWRAMTGAAGGRPVSFDHVESTLRLTELAEAGAIDFPGHRVERIGPRLVLKSRFAATSRRSPQGGSNDFEYRLSVPGEVVVPCIQSVISAESWPAGVEDARAISADPAVAVVRHDLCSSHLRVRNRHPGDRFRPLGVGGTKKLQDFFVDRKVPRHLRDSVPLVVDETGRIIWVAGYGIDESFRVTDSAQAVVVLRLKLLGGPA
jgi:tRNA(Ile)-lysidine synthase